MATLLTTPVPHTDGAAFIRNKPVVTRAVFDALAPDLQARSYLITGVECLDTVARVRELTARLSLGDDYDEIKDAIYAELSPWLISSTDPEERQKESAAASRRAELLLRMHGWQAYAQTQDALLRAHEDVFPYRMYISSEDDKVRPSHAALNKKILPASHPFWENHTPPWEYNCRCDCVGMTQEEVDEIAASETNKAPENQQVLGPAQLREIEKNQRIVKPNGKGFLDIRTPRERSADGSGYEFRPADNALDIDQILARFTPAERQTFEAYAAQQTLEDGRTLLDWWKEGRNPAVPRPTVRPAPAAPVAKPAPAPAPAPSAPATPGSPAPVSAAIDIRIRNTKAPARTIALIDAIHSDGVLPRIPLNGSVGKGNLGVYRAYTSGKVDSIGVRAGGTWPHMTTAHEIGHFLDHQALGTKPGLYASKDASSAVGAIIAELRKTPSWQAIATKAGTARMRSYYESAHETWARAYAQFIATESKDPEMLKELDRIRNGIASWRQWTDAEFAPIATLIRNLFTTLQWIPKKNP